MTTEKRQRQRAARLEKSAAAASAAKREKVKRTAIRLVVAAAVVLAVLFGVSQLMGDDADTETTTDEAETETTVATTELPEPEYANPDLAEEVLAREPPQPTPPPEDTAPDALAVTTLIDGEGEEAQAGDILTVHYAGVLSDGTTFDESWSRGEPFPVTLGQGMVITGWDQGLIGAKIGERRHLVIGADNAYGEAGQGPIPPGSPLAFDVDVIDIQPAGG